MNFESSNILFKNNKIKLADFGSAKELNENEMSREHGTPGYRSRELMSGAKYDGKTDIWSTGCVIFELIYLKQYCLVEDDRNFCEIISGKLFSLLKLYACLYLFLSSHSINKLFFLIIEC